MTTNRRNSEVVRQQLTSAPTESERLAALESLRVLDTLPDPAFDKLARAAALACSVPISQVSLVDATRQWCKANVGLTELAETPRTLSFCHHAIAEGGLFEVHDATADPRFVDNPFVTGPQHIRFYAGSTLQLSDGFHVGTLCVVDRVPRTLTPEQREILTSLSSVAVELLEGRRTAYELTLSEARFRALSESSPLGVFTADSKGECTYVNERWEDFAGLEREDALGRGWIRALHPEDKEGVLAEWRGATLFQRDAEKEFRVRHDDSSVHHVRVVTRPTLTRLGEVSGHVGSMENITERVRRRRALTRAHKRLRVATESGGIGVWETDVREGRTTCTAEMYALFGLPSDDEPIAHRRWFGRLHPEDRRRVMRVLGEVLEAGERLDIEFRLAPGEGDIRYLRASARIDRDTDGSAVCMTGACWDVTSLRCLADELTDKHELLRVTLQSIDDAVITTDASGRVTSLNPAAERMSGFQSEEVVGEPLARVFHPLDEMTRHPIIDRLVACTGDLRTIVPPRHALLVSRDGTERCIENSISPILDRRGALRGAVLVFRDVTEQRRLSSEMAYRAMHDPLTKLFNRSEFEMRLESRLEKSREDGSDNALMYIDLDQFKLVNDACGHAAGDALLAEVGRLLGGAVRDSDTLARLGGDEFGVILPHCSSEQALRVAQLICDRMETFRFVHDGKRFRIGTSIGLVPLDRRWKDASAVMQAADASCYAAKEAGRNRVHVWFDSDAAIRDRRDDMKWATRLTQALDEKRFALHVQRIEPLGSERGGLRAEMLIRLREPDGRLIMPSAFLPAAERFELAARIDRWVLGRTIETLEAALARTDIELLCVNLSGRSIGDRNFHRDAIAMLEAAGGDVCRRLCLEVTETTAVTNMTDTMRFVERVRALGVRVALDGFGAGASAFGYLRLLSVDLIKIDGSFIADLIDEPLNEAAVRCFVGVARLMGLKTVAEFVDDEAKLERVRELGIDYGQGFVLHRPEPVETSLPGTPAAVA